MKKSFIIFAVALSLAACKAPHPINHNDSTECAVFEGWPVVHEENFEIEAVFVPLDELSIDTTGLTVWIDDNGFTVMPVRDSETMQFITKGLQRVKLHDRILPNKYKKLH